MVPMESMKYMSQMGLTSATKISALNSVINIMRSLKPSKLIFNESVDMILEMHKCGIKADYVIPGYTRMMSGVLVKNQQSSYTQNLINFNNTSIKEYKDILMNHVNANNISIDITPSVINKIPDAVIYYHDSCENLIDREVDAEKARELLTSLEKIPIIDLHKTEFPGEFEVLMRKMIEFDASFGKSIYSNLLLTEYRHNIDTSLSGFK